MKRNIIVGQSGGPTAAINSSLAGVYHGGMACGAAHVYGMLNGIQGLLERRYIDLSDHIKSPLDLELLKRTPASFLGSCRYKLPDIDKDRNSYKRLFETLDKLEIDALVYIGGNDSMDTIKKLSDYGEQIGHPCRFVGCPKTIDNDLALTDHTPGYGSAAKYIATSVKEVIRDARCMEYAKGMVVVIEIMGRDAGWLTGAAALSSGEDCDGPDMIYLPEIPFDMADFEERIDTLLVDKGIAIVAVSEGIRDASGTYVCELGSQSDFVDAFGHKQLTGTASYLASYVAAKTGCKSRAIELSTLQRAASHLISQTDIEEAYMAGTAAAKCADEGQSGKMVAFSRTQCDPYRCGTVIEDVHQIANEERLVPREWVNKEGVYVTQEFIDYALPLIQGELAPIIVDGLPRHLITPKELQ